MPRSLPLPFFALGKSRLPLPCFFFGKSRLPLPRFLARGRLSR